LVCSECGSYQPDRAKFCGICGAGLSQEGLMEKFLGDDREHDIILPRHRSFTFFLVIICVTILALAAFAGAGYIVYLVAWGSDEPAGEDRKPEDKTQAYTDAELGFSIKYPENWSLEKGLEEGDELTALTLSLSARKKMEIRAYRLDPIISIGGIKAIEEHLVEDATERIGVLGGRMASIPAAQPETGQPGYGQEEPSSPAEDDAAAPGEAEGLPVTPEPAEDGAEGTAAEDMFKSSRISGLPAFSTEFTANYMGEETEFLLYYIVAGDLVFLFQGRAPANEYQAVRPQLYSITVSFRWVKAADEQVPDEQAPAEMPI
jgi:hypothetical protein